MIDSGHEGERSALAEFRDGGASVQVRPGKYLDRIIQEAVEIQLFPVGMKDMTLPFPSDGLQEFKVKRAHEFFILFQGKGFRRGGNRKENTGGSPFQAGQGISDEILIDDLQGL